MKQPVFIAMATSMLCLINFNISGQKSTINYNLSSYKLPELKRHVLEVQFDFNQNRTYSNQRTDFDTTHSHNTNLTLNLNPTYSYYLNTKRLQFETYTSFEPLYFNYQRYYDGSANSHNREINATIAHNGEYRFYLIGRFFIESDVISHISYRQEYDKELNTKINDYNHSITIPILLGGGRIERIEDARLAVYILDDLKKHNQLNKEPTQDEITFFAQFLSKLENERFMDYREKKIWALQQIDSFMVASDLIKENNVLSISLINDNWDYADGPARESGFRISGGIVNGINNGYNSQKYDNSVNNYNQSYFAYHTGITGKLDYENPINLYWQFFIKNNIGAYMNLKGNTRTQNDIDNTQSFTILYATNDFMCGLGYYPNSRTNINFNLSLNTSFSKSINTSEDALESNDESNNIYFYPGINITGYYYVSKQLRFELNTGLNHSYQKNIQEDSPENYENRNNNGNVYFRIGLNYKIL